MCIRSFIPTDFLAVFSTVVFSLWWSQSHNVCRTNYSPYLHLQPHRSTTHLLREIFTARLRTCSQDNIQEEWGKRGKEDRVECVHDCDFARVKEAAGDVRLCYVFPHQPTKMQEESWYVHPNFPKISKAGNCIPCPACESMYWLRIHDQLHPVQKYIVIQFITCIFLVPSKVPIL